MLRIRALQLPISYPSDRSIESCGQTRCCYEPEFWEFEYEAYRYLENIADDNLLERYRNIVRNMSRIVSRERDVIPIKLFLSSWYWYRKEHQTRLEFHLRKIVSLPVSPPEEPPNNDGADAPSRPRSPNSGDVLFRFDKSCYMVPFVEKGAVRISPASKHLTGMHGDPRTDDELSKHSFLPGRHTRIRTKSGQEIPVIGNFQRTISCPDYYDLCMTCGYHGSLFSDFSADTCVVITSPVVFSERISQAAEAYLPGWYFFHGPIQYFDPYNMDPHEVFNPTISKDFSFAYQMEYRYLWFPEERYSAKDYIYLNLGSINDIAFLYGLPP